jgi:hypothetical protein
LAACHGIAGVEEKTFAQSGGRSPDSGGVEAGNDSGARVRGAAPPSRPGGDRNPGGGVTVAFALHRLDQGSTDPKTGADAGAYWSNLGFDLDHETTTQESLETGTSRACRSIAEPHLLVDGPGGRDNLFGANIVSTVKMADPGFEQDTNAGLHEGVGTLLVVLEDLGDGPDDPYVPATAYFTADDRSTPAPPRWTGEDRRRIVTRSFVPGTTQPHTRFPRGYVRDGTWVSGELTDGYTFTWLTVRPGDQPGVLARMHTKLGVMTMSLAGDRSSAEGAFAFVITPYDLGEFIRPFLEANLACQNPSGVNALIDSFASKRDVLIVGTDTPEPWKDCDGISGGLGMGWIRVATPNLPDDAWNEPTTAVCP